MGSRMAARWQSTHSLLWGLPQRKAKVRLHYHSRPPRLNNFLPSLLPSMSMLIHRGST